MNLAHIHLMFNHFPTIGTLVALGLLLGSAISKNEHEKRAGLAVLAAMSMMTFPAFMSGRAAQGVLGSLCPQRPSQPRSSPGSSRLC